MVLSLLQSTMVVFCIKKVLMGMVMKFKTTHVSYGLLHSMQTILTQQSGA